MTLKRNIVQTSTVLGLRIDKLGVRFTYETSEDGYIRAYLKAASDETGSYHESPPRIPLYSTAMVRQIPEAQGWRKFSLIVEVNCKRNPCVFHHTQLFLQHQTATFFQREGKKYPLKFNFTFL